MKSRKERGVLLVSAILVLQITGCGNPGAADRSAENTGTENAETENTILQKSETATDANRVLIAYFTAGENSDVDAVSYACVVTVDGEAKGCLRAVADMIQAETNGTLFPYRLL